MSHPAHERHSSEEDGHAACYCIAARYRCEHLAGRVYARAQSTLFAAEGCDLSAFRLQLDRIWHVVILGEQLTPALDRRLRLILSSGTPAQLPNDVVDILLARHAEATRLGLWVERHHRPREQLTDL
ncbi:MAG: hypothetical protein IT305_27100 [Chloroflexi bacterium]|nr:hypothetical protein [Chloroflexota bacterium]